MIVDEFIENPKPLSAFSNPENHWPVNYSSLHSKTSMCCVI
jgi:hypothetical protein